MNFDLNIKNYKKDELIEMFDLPPNYDMSLVNSKESQLRDSILGNSAVKEDVKAKTIFFLTEAKKILLGDVYSKVKHAEEKVEDFFHSIYDLKPTEIENKDEHMVQVRKSHPYLSSFPSEFFPGVINPIKRRINKQNLNIDTRFRDNYYGSPSSNFNVTLPLVINNVLTMQLAAIELPTTFYNVSKQSGNNFFTLTVDGISQVVTIPSGNYTYTGIVNLLNTTMINITNNDANPPQLENFKYIVFGININNNNGSGEMFVGVDSNAPDPIIFSLNFQANRFGEYDSNTPLPLKFGWIMGFRNGIYENNQSYVSEGIVDLLGPRYLYLVVDDFNNNVNNSFYSAFNASILNKNILARLSLQSNTFNIFSENNLNILTTPRQYFGPVKIQNLNIQLLDEYGRIIDLNNMDFSFSLTFQTVYDL
jgi:hypothetical protein